MVDGTVDGKNNKEEKTREVTDTMIDVSLQLEISSTRMWYAVVMVVDMKVFYTSNMSDNI